MAAPQPVCKILVRQDGDTALYSGRSPFEQKTAPTGFQAADGPFCFSQDGSLLAVAGREVVTVYAAESETLLYEIDVPDVALLSLSPRSTFLTTWRKAKEGSSDRNLTVRALASKSPVLELSQKTASKDAWPAMQFSDSETVAAHAVANLVNIYAVQGTQFTLSKKLPLQGLAGSGLAPTGAHIAAFVPEKKGNPGRAALYDVARLPDAGVDSRDPPQAMSSRSLMGAQNMNFHWNSRGTSLVLMAAQDVDKSNQSYYGKQNVYFMSLDGANDGPVPLAKEGPVYDVAWAPNGEYFVVIHGFMPAKAILFDYKCKPIFDFGTLPVNLVRWSPHSRFLAMAGFGNLPGDIFFYDKKADGKCKRVGETRCPSVTLDWSPCGRAVLTAITTPRLRVDNGFRIIKYTGEELQHVPVPVLYEARWRPSPAGAFPDRPATPPGQRAKAAPAADAPAPAPAPAVGPGKGYIPPHLRGREGAGVPGASPTTIPTLGFAPAPDADPTKDQGARVTAAKGSAFQPKGGRALPVGFAPAEPASKAASKNAKRRAKKKEGKDGEGAGDA